MFKKVILHIGAPKCGSTYLQKVMLKNQENLISKGFYYPTPPGEHPGNASDLSIYQFDNLINDESLFEEGNRMENKTRHSIFKYRHHSPILILCFTI